MFSWLTPNKNKKKVDKQTTNNKQNLRVGDTIVVNYDPFKKHPTRGAVVESVVSGGYKVRFTSTKGESCDGGVRKVFQKADGTFVTTTTVTANITYSQIK